LIYYTVYDSGGKKISDCGSELDAKFLAEQRKGTYKTNRIEDWFHTIEVEPINLKLCAVSIDCKKVEEQKKLPIQQQQPLEL